jgi:hypothetical protein
MIPAPLRSLTLVELLEHRPLARRHCGEYVSATLRITLPAYNVWLSTGYDLRWARPRVTVEERYEVGGVWHWDVGADYPAEVPSIDLLREFIWQTEGRIERLTTAQSTRRVIDSWVVYEARIADLQADAALARRVLRQVREAA